jgi:hypothetical protein
MILSGEGGRILYNGLQAAGGRIMGTPQSFKRLRSKVLAATTVFGPYTCQINLCPNEYTSKWACELAGEAYTFEPSGSPTVTRHIEDCKTLLSANPPAVRVPNKYSLYLLKI